MMAASTGKAARAVIRIIFQNNRMKRCSSGDEEGEEYAGLKREVEEKCLLTMQHE
jgi:hypothetical protein